MPRLFVAVSLPGDARIALENLFHGVPPLRGARRVGVAQLHATLRFLGPVSPERAEAIAASLAAVAAPAFDTRLAGLGTFPPGRKAARVLWAALEPSAPLEALKRAVDRALEPVVGLDPESGRGFHPHVTLARFKDRAGPDLAPFLERHRAFAGPAWRVASFEVYESRLRPTGAEYTIVCSYRLAG
jgi:2'-5' RNA ligase